MYRKYGITYPFEFMDICEDIFNNLAGFIAIENKRTTGFFNLQDERMDGDCEIYTDGNMWVSLPSVSIAQRLTILGARFSRKRSPAFVLGLTIFVDGALLPFPDIMNAFVQLVSICKL